MVGCSLSFFASFVVLVLWLRDRRVIYQVRPRMLIVLMLLDMIASAFFIVSFVPPVYYSSAFAVYQIFNNFLGPIFFQMSWVWTCCIAFHVYW